MALTFVGLAFGMEMSAKLSDEEFAERARFLLRRGEIAALPQVLALAERHAAIWPTAAGQEVLIEALGLLLDTIVLGRVDDALEAMAPCPPSLASLMHDLLLTTFYGEPRFGDPLMLDDAALLCAAMLMGASGRSAEVAPFLATVGRDRHEAHFGPPAAMVVARYAPAAAAAAEEDFVPKLIIWDLDETLWAGTLADGDAPRLDETRAAFVRAFNERGVVSAICSKNEMAAARAVLEGFGLWDAFVFPRIAFVPKGAVVARMIADMQLRPANVLFVDDNPHNLHEVAHAVPGIRTIDARSPDCDPFLQQLLDRQAHVTKSRVEDYRLLEAKVAARGESGAVDAAFLLASDIQATAVDRMDNLAFADRIEELINRSNQLNYTASRVEPGAITARILDIDNYKVFSAFVWDRYGYYGLVGVAVFNFRTSVLEHFVFSCRVMHMGVEDFLLDILAQDGNQVHGGQLRKPLPPRGVKAIRPMSFADPAVRERVLAAEAPRDPSAIRMRIMADCQSGAFHHYSRFGDETDHDNNPRLFSLPQMLTGAFAEQHFPRFLVYAAATDYIDWRWLALAPQVEAGLLRAAAERFVDMVVEGDHQCLLMLPPDTGPIERFELHAGCVPERSRAIHPFLNAIWRDLAGRHPDRFTVIELGALLSAEDMVHNHHYVPSALRRIAGLMDDWYAPRRDAGSPREQPLAA